jgi:DNA replication initiation complex subunit (GINS family)
MVIYLYIKTHSITGLKYLGKTNRKDPHNYLGSGTYWRSHLDKHGKDYTTEIVKVCQTKEELIHWGLYYSNLWNIVEAKYNDGRKVWANLKPENGDGGSLPGEHSYRYGKKHSDETKKKISSRTTGKIVSKATRDKMSATRKGSPGRPRTDAEKKLLSTIHKGKVVSIETREKTSKALTGKPKSESHKAKLQEIAKTRRKPIMTPDGIFDSRCAAAKHYQIKPESIGSRIVRDPTKYYYC